MHFYAQYTFCVNVAVLKIIKQTCLNEPELLCYV